VQPIFGFGRLRRQEQVAREAYKQQAENYEKTVLTALQEVESALVAIETYRAQVVRYDEYVQANERIAQLTEALYKMGMSNYLDVISTAQTWYESQLQFVTILSQQYINYAELVMALGDGWQGIDSQ
jgi:multidrug efflux system outer membrane protein